MQFRRQLKTFLFVKDYRLRRLVTLAFKRRIQILLLTYLLTYKLRALFATGQWRHPPRSAVTHAMSQPSAVTTRPRAGLESCIHLLLHHAPCRCGSPPSSDQGRLLAGHMSGLINSEVSRAEVRPSDEHGMLARCLAGRRTRFQQCCESLSDPVSATRFCSGR